jgi:hypothetical protein
MTENADSTEDVFPESKYSIELPTMPGMRNIWDEVVERHGEELVEVFREVLPEHTGSNQDLLYRYSVAEVFLETNEVKEGIKNGKETNQARLEKAIQSVSNTNEVGYETVRQACVRAYSGRDRNEQFKRDLKKVEDQTGG